MSAEKIDIRWIPLAKASWHALREQEALVVAHVGRLAATRDRYAAGSIPYAVAALEVALWERIGEIVAANLAGTTVQPS